MSGIKHNSVFGLQGMLNGIRNSRLIMEGKWPKDNYMPAGRSGFSTFTPEELSNMELRIEDALRKLNSRKRKVELWKLRAYYYKNELKKHQEQ